MKQEKLTAAFSAAPASNTISYITAAYPDGAISECEVLGLVLPARERRLCWLGAERMDSRRWLLTRYSAPMSQKEAAIEKEEFSLEGSRVSNGTVIRALSAWVKSRNHPAILGLSESLHPEAMKVTVEARQAYGPKLRR